MTNARILRNILLSEEFKDSDGNVLIQDVQAYLADAEGELATLKAQGVSDDKMGGVRLKIFCTCLILASIGYMDAPEKALLLYKYVPPSIQKLGAYVWSMVPFPSPNLDYIARLEWFQVNKDRLQWNNERETFVLSDDP